jgi:hypothetical protein
MIWRSMVLWEVSFEYEQVSLLASMNNPMLRIRMSMDRDDEQPLLGWLNDWSNLDWRCSYTPDEKVMDSNSSSEWLEAR